MAVIQKNPLSLATQFQNMEQFCAHEHVSWEF